MPNESKKDIIEVTAFVSCPIKCVVGAEALTKETLGSFSYAVTAS